MKIGVNLYPLRPRIAGGMEFYVRNLFPALFEQSSEHTYSIVTAPWNHDELDFGKGPYRKVCIGRATSGWRRIRNLWRSQQDDMYRLMKELKSDIWFCPMIDLDPKYPDIPSVITVPDLQHEFYPQFFSAEELRHRALMIKPSCQLATGVMTISDHSRQSFIEKLELEPEKIFRVHLAAGSNYSRPTARARWSDVSREYGLQEGYLFYPANTWPHKNHEMLLLALERLKKRGLKPQLVLTGSRVGSNELLEELASQLDITDQVKHLGFVDEDLFPGLYGGAGCLVFPSLFEGFGIPLVEAMVAGCAIAASDACSIPEVAKDAAAYFDPRNPDSIADAVEHILTDRSHRETLIANGERRAGYFSWAKAARETLKIFETTRTRPVKSQDPRLLPPQAMLEGTFPDGWAGPRVLIRRVELGRWTRLEMRGEVTGACYPLRIRIRGGRSFSHELNVSGPDTMSRDFELPEPTSGTTLIDIQIRANRHFVPKDSGESNDPRALSFRISSLALVDAQGGRLELYGES